MDSMSVKASHHVDSDRGIDGNKKIKRRKEHIIVNTLGLPLAVASHEANLCSQALLVPIVIGIDSVLHPAIPTFG